MCYPLSRSSAHEHETETDRVKVGETDVLIAPRGTRRILYCNDPSSILFVNLLPNPVEADDLRRWVDMVADSGVDTLLQDI